MKKQNSFLFSLFLLSLVTSIAVIYLTGVWLEYFPGDISSKETFLVPLLAVVLATGIFLVFSFADFKEKQTRLSDDLQELIKSYDEVLSQYKPTLVRLEANMLNLRVLLPPDGVELLADGKRIVLAIEERIAKVKNLLGHCSEAGMAEAYSLLKSDLTFTNEDLQVSLLGETPLKPLSLQAAEAELEFLFTEFEEFTEVSLSA